MITVSGTQFHIRGRNTSYVMSIYQNRYLVHLYWGERLEHDMDLTHLPEEYGVNRASAFHVPMPGENKVFLTDQKFEFSVFGGGDYRVPTCHIRHEDASTVTELEYEGYTILEGKPGLAGLPHIYAEQPGEAETLQIAFCNRQAKVRVVLSYTMFEDYDVLTRSIRYINEGDEALHLLSAQSCCVDFSSNRYKLLHLHGDWLRETSVEFVPVTHGIYTVDSKRGMSSHMNNPFVALMDQNADESTGSVYGFALVYSGNFSAEIEGHSNGSTRVTMGINAFNFDWTLDGGDAFQTPEVAMVYSPAGLNEMSGKYHRIFRERLMRGQYRNAVRPIVANNWEATEMNFDEDKLLAIAQKASELECELFVIDDGWFGERNADNSSLGDWTVNKKKLPSGLKGIAEKVNGMGMKLGLWFEPEMVSPDSDLYRRHPDWCLHCQGRSRTENRNQLVLDLTRAEVREYLVESVSQVLRSANIEYVKWDCNRNITETQTQMQYHQYVLGLYEVLERLTSRFPQVLFEGCSGGGGRFDPGMLYYMPQTWTSDNTTVRGRYRIQYGTSVVYPACSMAAHIAKINPDAEPEDPYLNSSALVSMSGVFGFEFDLSRINDSVKEQALRYVRLYKQLRGTILYGAMFRLESPFEGNLLSWMFVDDSRAVLFHFQTESQTNGEERRLKLKGLDQNALYECRGRRYYGEELMKSGLKIPLEAYENHAGIMIFQKVQES